MNGPDDSTSSLFGTWQTESLGGEPVAKGVVSTVTFTDDGRVHGHAGVNRFMGGFKQLEGAIEFAPLATTRMAGIEPASSHETGLLAALTGRRPFSVDAEILMVGSGADEVRFRRIVDAAGDTAAPETFELSGSVSYRERVALQPGAVATVQLSDVSLADAPSTLIAEQVIETGAQVPLPFSLTVARSALQDNHRYSLSARITVDGQLAWTSDTHIPVGTSEATTGIDLRVVRAS